ncbi:MAG TPA: ester cyclase, partial [Kofleriaceae bacterium]|nr:ester cyclase [Kofleriaceae bacterium]
MDRLLKLTAIAAALLVVAPACGKKDKDKNKNKPNTTAPKTTSPTTPTPPKEPPPAPKMTSQDLAKKYQDCWGFVSAKDWDKFKGCYTADATSEWIDSGMPTLNGIDAIIDQDKKYMAAFPDWKGMPQLILVGHNKVFSIAVVTGTHEGPLATPAGDIPATHKKMGMLVAHGVVFNDKGEATQEWFLQDFGTMLGQLGLAPKGMPFRAVMDKGWTETPEVVIAA